VRRYARTIGGSETCYRAITVTPRDENEMPARPRMGRTSTLGRDRHPARPHRLDVHLPEHEDGVDSGGGDQIADIASTVGYGTFPTEHLVVGLGLGLLLASRRRAA